MTAITIEHTTGTERFVNFEFVEKLADDVDPYDGDGQTIRVWFSDPSVNDDNYTDFTEAEIVDVNPNPAGEPMQEARAWVQFADDVPNIFIDLLIETLEEREFINTNWVPSGPMDAHDELVIEEVHDGRDE